MFLCTLRVKATLWKTKRFVQLLAARKLEMLLFLEPLVNRTIPGLKLFGTIFVYAVKHSASTPLESQTTSLIKVFEYLHFLHQKRSKHVRFT